MRSRINRSCKLKKTSLRKRNKQISKSKTNIGEDSPGDNNFTNMGRKKRPDQIVKREKKREDQKVRGRGKINDFNYILALEIINTLLFIYIWMYVFDVYFNL